MKRTLHWKKKLRLFEHNTLIHGMLAAAGNSAEFHQRLQWLSEGMLHNHLFPCDQPRRQSEIRAYEQYKMLLQAVTVYRLSYSVSPNLWPCLGNSFSSFELESNDRISGFLAGYYFALEHGREPE